MRTVFRVIAIAVVLTLALPFLILSLPVLLLWACARLCGVGFRENRTEIDDETRLMQRIHGDMVRMDRRVESLETLLLEDSARRTDGFDDQWTEPVSMRDEYANRH